MGIYNFQSRFVPKILSECEALARRDGFENFAEMMEFWKDRLPFRGHIVHWLGARPTSEAS
jgi:hypothetical protein